MLVTGFLKPSLRPLILGRLFVASRRFHISLVVKGRHSSSYKSTDYTADQDDIRTENNSWSPTLYTDIVYIREPHSLKSRSLPSNLRLSYSSLYESPGAKYVSVLKRFSLSASVLGLYGAKLFYDSPQFEDIYAYITAASFLLPTLFVQFKTRDYVTRIFRLYDREKPQTLENLVSDEKLIMEKLNFSGGKTYNELLTVSKNETLRLAPPTKFPLIMPYRTWEETLETGKKRYFYVVDDIGGIKMDRLWGIVEHNSNVDNGRYIDDQVKTE